MIPKAGPHVWAQLYAAERQRLVEAADLAIRCGIEAERVKLAESQGRLIAELIRQVLDDPTSGHNGKQRELSRKVAAGHLRLLASAT